jgi:hypothetical protein
MRFLAVACLVAFAACGSKSAAAGVADAGQAGDSAALADSADAAAATDSGKAGDSTAEVDAGPAADAGEVSDATTAADSGPVDAAAQEVGADVAPADLAADQGGAADLPPDAPADVSPDAPADVSPDAPADAAPGGPIVAGNLVQYSVSFGKCSTACQSVVEFKGAAMVLTVTDKSAAPTYMAKGILTTGAAAKLQDFEAQLVGKPLAETSGCPGCADGGIATVTFSDGKKTTTHTYDASNPPAQLSGLHALVALAAADLNACKSDETVVVSKPCPLDLP